MLSASGVRLSMLFVPWHNLIDSSLAAASTLGLEALNAHVHARDRLMMVRDFVDGVAASMVARGHERTALPW